MSEIVELTEGYHDRAFWKGLLEHAGCTNLATAGAGAPIRVLDPWNVPVTRGQFAFRSRGGKFIRVQPCNGKQNIARVAGIRLQERTTKPVEQLILSIDTDVAAGDVSTGDAIAKVVQSALQSVRQDAVADSTGRWALDEKTVLAVMYWSADDPLMGQLPDRQCLERLVTASLNAVYPDRAAAVQKWLESRPLPQINDPKSFTWSHMAGWYSRLGCDAFLSELWADQPVAEQLISRLRRGDAWKVVEAIVT